MGILKLDKNQEEKLLKLCSEFFPEYKNIELCSENEYVCMFSYKHNFDYNPLDGRNPYKTYISIHWYQLCMTELPKRIFDKIDFGKISIFDVGIYNSETLPECIIKSEKHPVNFLCNFVKYCKDNKYFKQ